jgi:hypothetical protein
MSGPRPPSARVLGMPSPYCALWAIRLQAVSAPANRMDSFMVSSNCV